MKRVVLALIAAVLLGATVGSVRSAAAGNTAGSVTVRVAMCAPGMTLATLNPEGCVGIGSEFDLALYDFANDLSYGMIDAIDNGDGSFSWLGLTVDDALEGGLAGRFRLAVQATPEGTAAYAAVGDYDPDGDVAYLTGEGPDAAIDLYFFQDHAIDDVIVDDPDLEGAVHVSAFSCPEGVEPQDPDGWAAACVDPMNGMTFMLSGVDAPGVREMRVTGQELVGTAVFAGLDPAGYSLGKGPFDKLTLGFWSCDVAAEYGVDGDVAFQLDSAEEIFCAYYWLVDAEVIDEEPVPVSTDAQSSIVALPDTGSGTVTGARDAGGLMVVGMGITLLAMGVLGRGVVRS